jgi:two-component system phosphate regulon sensor histidine kinase PhoR
MRGRIFRSITLVSLLGVLLACLAVVGVLLGQFYGDLRRDLHREMRALTAAIAAEGEGVLPAFAAAGWRITLMDSTGAVLYDSRRDAAQLAGHADRPEVASAMATGQGEARRMSATLATQTFYYAQRLPDGRILRLAGDMQSVYGAVWQCVPYLGLVAAAVALIAGLAAGQETRRIVAPLEHLDLEHPLHNAVYPELSGLLRRIDHQNNQLKERHAALQQAQRELSAVMDSMQEGLILFGPGGYVLSMNPAAGRILEVDAQAAVGEHILSFYRSPELMALIEGCTDGRPGEMTLSRGGRVYRLTASPAGERGGGVLLLLDVTERQEAESLRQEFSANVSHELKTPLTAISGYAELIAKGMAKAEDIPRFAATIHAEAARLIALVGDIIRLSRLDENAPLPRESVDLHSLCAGVLTRLKEKAEAAGINLSLTGQPIIIEGAPHILEEMVRNLVENAVQYNRPGGEVQVNLTPQPDGGVQLSVEDNGIGIPVEHQSRIFERFYRVDKSHTRATGGTGLGLSIVKHGAAYHHAALALESAEGRGTKVTLTFPGRTNTKTPA